MPNTDEPHLSRFAPVNYAKWRVDNLHQNLQARNPSDDEVLVSLAEEIGLDRRGFAQALNLESTQLVLDREIALARRMGANSFPGLVLETRDGIRMIRHDYMNADLVLAQLR